MNYYSALKSSRRGRIGGTAEALRRVGLNPEEEIARFQRPRPLQRLGEAARRVGYAEPRATAFAVSRAGRAWREKPKEGFGAGVWQLLEMTPPGMAINWWRGLGSTLKRGEESIAAGYAPSERIGQTPWGERHPWAAGVPGLAADILASPSTLVTASVGGALRAAGAAGKAIVERSLPGLFSRAGIKEVAPRLVQKAGQEEFARNAVRLGEIAGREGYVSPRLVEGWINKVTPHAGERALLREVGEAAARAGEEVAGGGIRYGIGKTSIPIVGRAALRRGVERVSGVAGRVPVVGRTAEALGRALRPGYIRPGTELLPMERQLAEEAVRQSWRSKSAAMEKVAEDVKGVAGKLKAPEARLVPDLMQLPGLPLKEELPDLGEALREAHQVARKNAAELMEEMKHPSVARVIEEGRDKYLNRLGKERDVVVKEMEHLGDLEMRFSALRPERQLKVAATVRAARSWFEELWRSEVFPAQQERLFQAQKAASVKEGMQLLGLVGKKRRVSTVGKTRTVGRALAVLEKRLQSLLQVSNRRWAKETERRGMPGVTRQQVAETVGQIGPALQSISQKVAAEAPDLPETSLRILQVLERFGKELPADVPGETGAEKAIAWLQGRKGPVRQVAAPVVRHIPAEAKEDWFARIRREEEAKMWMEDATTLEDVERRIEARMKNEQPRPAQTVGGVPALEAAIGERARPWTPEERVEELTRRIVEEAKPGYSEQYVPGVPQAGLGRLPLQALGRPKEFFERAKTYPTLAERDIATATVQERLGRLQSLHGELVQKWTEGESKGTIPMMLFGKVRNKTMPIEHAIQEVADKFYNLAPTGARLSAERDIRALMLARGVRGSTVAARRELLQTLRSKIAVPKSEAPARVGWVEPSYPELKGYLILKEVGQDLERHLNVLVGREQIGGGVVGQAYAAWMRLWRWSLTAGRPAWALMTNPQGNIYNGVVLAGMNPLKVWANFVDGIKLLRYLNDDAGKFYSEGAEKLGEGGLFRHGEPVFDVAGKRVPADEVARSFQREGGMSSFGRTEVPGLKELPVLGGKLQAASEWAAAVGGRAHQVFEYASPRAIANYTERLSKAALFVDGLRKGMRVEDAGARMRKYLFAYGELTPAERAIRNFAVPFYTWTKNNTGLQLESFLTKPGIQLATVRAKAIAQNNLSEIPYQEMPPWVGGSSLFPIGGTEEKTKFITQYLPLYDITRLGDLRSLMSNFYPFYTVPSSLVLGREFGTGRDLSPGRMAPFPIGPAASVAPDIAKAFGIERIEYPPGTGRKMWGWPAKTGYVFGQVFPYLAYSGRYMQEPVPEKRIQQVQQFILGLSTREITREDVERSRAAQEKAARAAAAKYYRFRGMLPPTREQKRRAAEYLRGPSS